ncbi:MAG: hypothetical protein O8C58_05000 [Candidatus Methanoperedens sp.]|nr:hypothetical protein [Candidatus Methanoperedens sp.]
MKKETGLADAPQTKRDEMITFLKGHFRYDTMNFWNRSTSYAWNVKIYRLGLTHEQEMKAYDFIETPGALDDITQIMRDFDANHDHEWQAGFNGRSGGYIVLYKGFKEADTHTKTICNHCGIRTGYTEEIPCKVNGCSGTLKKIVRPVYRIGVYPGKGIDMNEDFEDWSDDTLEARYGQVKEFDQMVDDCISQFKYLLDNFRIVEKEVPCTRTIRVVEPIAAEA